MRRWLTCIAAGCFLAVAPVLAQIEDHPAPVPPKRSSQVKLGFAAGVSPSWLSLDLGPVNSVLAASNAATFSKGSLYMSGIQGYAYILFVPNLRVGGIGASGSMESSSLELASNTRRTVELSVGVGGVTIDYVVPVVPRLDITVGTVLGGGYMKFQMTRDNGAGKVWVDLWSDYGSAQPTAEYARTMEGSYFIYEPNIGVEVAIMRWLGVRASVGYLGTSGNSWTLDERYDITGVPDDVNPKGFRFSTGIYLGTFIF